MKSPKKAGTSNIQRSTLNVRCASFRHLSAFTLLEVLLAITITGFVLAAAASMLVSVTNIWSNRQESNFFEDHVDGVTEFVQSCFTIAGTSISLSDSDSSSGSKGTDTGTENNGNTPKVSLEVSGNRTNGNGTNSKDSSSSGSSLLRRADDPIGWAQPPGSSDHEDPLINFKLKDTPPLLVNTDNAPVVGIDAFLFFKKGEGLSLLWYSILQEEVEDENDLRRTLISPYITAVSYIYWDESFEKWEAEEDPQEGEDDEFLLPRFIKITFEHDDISKERTISIPVPSRSALLF